MGRGESWRKKYPEYDYLWPIVARRLLKLRESKNIAPQKAAEKLSVNQRQLARYEDPTDKKTSWPPFVFFKAAAHLYGVKWFELLRDEEVELPSLAPGSER